jgi:hypothetical protein
MVYKMIEKRKEMESQTSQTPMVFDQHLTDNLVMRESFPDNYTLKKKR